MQILFFWHTVCNFKPSVRSAGIISLFEQTEKGKKLSFTYLCNFLSEYRKLIFLRDIHEKDFHCHSIPTPFPLFIFPKNISYVQLELLLV